MGERKYTPGPWVTKYTKGAGWSVSTLNAREGYATQEPVCSMAWWQFDIAGVIDNSISRANANLIAAAPELLDALIYMRRTMYSETSEESIKADAAIAKALQREISEDVF